MRMIRKQRDGERHVIFEQYELLLVILNIGLMLVQRCRRWANIKPTLIYWWSLVIQKSANCDNDPMLF